LTKLQKKIPMKFRCNSKVKVNQWQLYLFISLQKKKKTRKEEKEREKKVEFDKIKILSMKTAQKGRHVLLRERKMSR
jgi:hypothetical protein